MKRKLGLIYATVCTLLLCGGFLFTFFFAWKEGINSVVECICGLTLGFILSPIVHEAGHIFFAKVCGMRLVYSKFFCFKISIKDGRSRLGISSPFAPDCTQVIPKRGGNMKKRAYKYALGGLIFSGVFFVAILVASILCSLFGATRFLLWGTFPYTAYLFFLNALPFTYASGKTDMLVYIGLKKGYDAEKNMISAMEIQGRLYAGESYAEIDEALYFNLPQLCEDEPLYAVMLDLRYRYYLEKGEMEKAADCLNRLACSQEYLSDEEVEKLAAELVYTHSVLGNTELAEENGKVCKKYLLGDCAQAKRILLAYSLANGKTDAAEALREQAEAALEREWIQGEAKFERILLSRLV